MDSFQREIENCAEIVLAGSSILYPTDTIWGLGCDATNSGAVQKVNQVKGRPADKGYIVLINRGFDFRSYLQNDGLFDPAFHQQFGKPVTVIYPEAKRIAPEALAPDGSVALRIVEEPFCDGLIRAIGVPLVSTSANKSGEPAPSFFKEISAAVKTEVDYVVNWRQDDESPKSPSMLVRKTGIAEYQVLRS